MSDEKKRKLDELKKEKVEMERKRLKLEIEIAVLELTIRFLIPFDKWEWWTVSANGHLVHSLKGLKDQNLFNVFKGVLTLHFSTDWLDFPWKEKLTFRHIVSLKLEDKDVGGWYDFDTESTLDFNECLKQAIQAIETKQIHPRTECEFELSRVFVNVPTNVVYFERIDIDEEEVEEKDKEKEDKEWVKEKDEKALCKHSFHLLAF